MSNISHEKRIEKEKKLMAEQHANALKNSGAGTFSSSNTRQQSGYDPLAHREFHVQTPESAARRALMQQPPKHPDQFPRVHGMTSVTLLEHRAITEQADFFHLLETKYGAKKEADGTYVKGTYEAAINRYHDDMELQRAKRSALIDKINEEKERRFHSAQMADAARFQQNFQRQRGKQTAAPDEQRESGWWQNMFGRAKAYYAHSARSHPYSQQHREESHARGGPAQGGPGQRRKMPRAKALEIMGFNPTSTPPYDALKKAFNKQALLLHPDKNLANPEEAAIKFKKMRRAFNSLIDKGTSDGDSEGGGIIKRRHKRHKTSKKARRNTRRKTRGKTHRKTHRKSNKRR